MEYCIENECEYLEKPSDEDGKEYCCADCCDVEDVLCCDRFS